jgi:hypothetical protein
MQVSIIIIIIIIIITQKLQLFYTEYSLVL